MTLVGGAVAGLLIGRRRARAVAAADGAPGRWWTPVLAGGAGALLAVTGSVGLVWVSYRVDEFREPRYTGALERAPAVVDAVKREFGDLDGMRGRLRVLAGQINELSQVAVGTGPSPDPGEVRILHISDIHLNPMGLEIAKDLATTFSVRAVVDTGDLTSFGLDGESRIGELVDQFSVPYYLVPGNHDSPENRAALGPPRQPDRARRRHRRHRRGPDPRRGRPGLHRARRHQPRGRARARATTTPTTSPAWCSGTGRTCWRWPAWRWPTSRWARSRS